MVDEVDGPMTKREFEIFQVPVGETLLGRVCNFVGRSTNSQVGLEVEILAFQDRPTTD